MENLTEKELDGVKDQLGQEQLIIKKYKTYAQNSTDPQLKSKCEQIAAQHQNHYSSLMGILS